MDSGKNLPPDLRAVRVTIDAQPIDDHRVAYPVPTSPIAAKLTRALCIAPKDDPMRITETMLVIEREMVRKYAAFLAQHGAIDREPTEQELTVIMQTASSALATMQIEAMALVGDALHATLGDPDADPGEVADSVAASMADNAIREALAAGRIKPEEVDDFREQIHQRLQEWTDERLRRMNDPEGNAPQD